MGQNQTPILPTVKMSFHTSESRSTRSSSPHSSRRSDESPSDTQRALDDADNDFYHQYHYNGSNLFPRPDSPVLDRFYPSLPPSPPSSHPTSNPSTSNVSFYDSSSDHPPSRRPSSDFPSTPSPPSSYASLGPSRPPSPPPLTVHEYANMTFDTQVFRLVVDKTFSHPILTHQLLHLDDTLRAIARNEEENMILRQSALTYWNMVDTASFRSLIAPIVNFCDILGRIHSDKSTEPLDYLQDFVHSYHEPEGSRSNPMDVDDIPSEAPEYHFPRAQNPHSFRQEQRLYRKPFCRIHERYGHATYMCYRWKCPMCDRMNPQHAPELCLGREEGDNDDEEPQSPWNQEVQV